MANLLSNTHISAATGKMGDLFDTFSNGRIITVFKESTRIISDDNPTDAVYGYGDEQGNVEYTYEDVSSNYPAIIRYKKSKENDVLAETDFRHPEAEAKLKIRQDAKDYITDGGTTEKIKFDDLDWTIVSGPEKRPYLTLNFYYYEVKRII
jgi:hypothetical protein